MRTGPKRTQPEIDDSAESDAAGAQRLRRIGRPAGFWFGTAETRRIADRPPPASDESPAARLSPTGRRPTARPLPHAPSAWRQLSITDSVMDKNRLGSVIFPEDRSKDKPFTWHYEKRRSGLAEFGIKNY